MEGAYHVLFIGALIVFTVLIGVMLVRSVIGPRITDRILSINMIGTMVICCIVILSQLLAEDYLADVALIYALISFVSVLVFATVYIPANPGRHFREHHIEYTSQDTGRDADERPVSSGKEGKDRTFLDALLDKLKAFLHMLGESLRPLGKILGSGLKRFAQGLKGFLVNVGVWLGPIGSAAAKAAKAAGGFVRGLFRSGGGEDR